MFSIQQRAIKAMYVWPVQVNKTVKASWRGKKNLMTHISAQLNSFFGGGDTVAGYG